jgi:hypothetical protein
MTTDNEMTDLLATIYASFGSGDASAWETMLGDDAMCIGTDEAEWWQGKDALMPAVKAQLSEMSAAGITITAGDPVVGGRGDVLWVADRPTLHLPDGSSVQLRATAVASRVDGSLVLEQMHLSAPAPNEEVVQQTLTI